jgi:hypothetical protein
MNKRKPANVTTPAGEGKLKHNAASFNRMEGNDGMSVPSSQRGGSNMFGSNDKGSGDSDKGTVKRRKGVSRTEKS